MLWGNAELVAHEQHLDHLRRAERQRLADEVTAQKRGGGLWRSIRQLLAGRLSEAKQSNVKLVEKAA